MEISIVAAVAVVGIVAVVAMVFRSSLRFRISDRELESRIDVEISDED